SCSVGAALGGDSTPLTTQWPPHTRSATSAQSTRHRPTITRPVHRLWGSRPKIALQRRGTGPMRPAQGVGQLPIRPHCPTTAPVAVSAVGVARTAALDPEPTSLPRRGTWTDHV